jgi:hypothetical protein
MEMILSCLIVSCLRHVLAATDQIHRNIDHDRDILVEIRASDLVNVNQER